MNRTLSPSKVIKIPAFEGSLPTRALYIYLPPGYSESEKRAYPILYMHDGQNCFAAYERDSFAGSWHADKTADRLILNGEMRPCIIVGVSNGKRARMAEYMPPYVQYSSHQNASPKSNKRVSVITGQADQTLAYYQTEVDPYIRNHYRVLDGPENVATCGSSMGGLYSAYIAMEQSDFARSHALMSPSFWITRLPSQTASASYAMIERFRNYHLPDAQSAEQYNSSQGNDQAKGLRLWLDCGTWGGAKGKGDDGLPLVLAARDALISSGFQEGHDLEVYIDEGAIHHEAAWAGRFDRVLRFLFPVSI